MGLGLPLGLVQQSIMVRVAVKGLGLRGGLGSEVWQTCSAFSAGMADLLRAVSCEVCARMPDGMRAPKP